MRPRSLVGRVAAGFVLAATASAVCRGGQTNTLRAEELLPENTIAIIAFRNLAGSIDKARSLGVTRILQEFDAPAIVKEKIGEVRGKAGMVLSMVNLDLEDIVNSLHGSAFLALLDLKGTPPTIPDLLFYTDVKPAEEARIRGALLVLKNVLMVQGIGSNVKAFRGVDITVFDIPALPVNVCLAFFRGGLIVSSSRDSLEDFIARAIDGRVDGQRSFSANPVVKKVLDRLGPGEDLVAFFDLGALFTRFCDRIPILQRRRIEATGLNIATIGYGIRVVPAIGRLRASGVKEALVVSAPELTGLLGVLDLPKLTIDDLSGMSGDLVSVRAAVDVTGAANRLASVAKTLAGDPAVGRISGVIENVCARFGLDVAGIAPALSGRITLAATPRGGSIVPDVTMSLESQNPEGLGTIVGTIAPVLFRDRLGQTAFEGKTIYTFVPQRDDLPALLSPCFVMDDTALRVSLSTQSLKRMIRTLGNEPPTVMEEMGKEPMGTAAAVMELSPQPSIVMAVDVPRIAGIAFEVMSLVPQKFSKRMRDVVGRMPPIEDLLAELCGAAVGLYTTSDSIAVESFAPAGSLPLFVSLAALGGDRTRGVQVPLPAPRAEEERF